MNKDKIAELLLTPDALVTLSMIDAKLLVEYMVLKKIEKGNILFLANQTDVKSDYMLLVLDGEVLIEVDTTGHGSSVVSIAGAGHLIGEMGVLDGAPRSATCTAQTTVEVAILSRYDLERLIMKHPEIASRFILAIAKRLADRVRLGNHKLFMLNQMNHAMQLELNAPMKKRPHRFLAPLEI